MQHTPIGVIAIVCMVLFGVVLAKQQGDADSAYEAAKQEYNQAKAIAPLGTSTKGGQTDPKSYREEWRNEQDLAAQREMAKWAWWMLVATCLSAIITSVGIFFVAETLAATRDTLGETREANKIAREIGEAQVRAYLTFEPLSLNLIAMNGVSAIPQLHFVLTNSGNSPANDITIFARCTASRHANAEPDGPTGGQLFETLQAGGRIANYIHIGKVLEEATAHDTYVGVRIVLKLTYRDVFNTVVEYNKTYLASGRPQHGIGSFPVHEWIDGNRAKDPWEEKKNSDEI